MKLDARVLLEGRRVMLLRTIDHIRAQQHEADANTDWKDLSAQRRRSELLIDLLGWYTRRLARVDDVLGRIAAAQNQKRSPGLRL